MAVVSILGSALTPRAKFLQMMLFNVVAVGLAAIFGLLTAYASVTARNNASLTSNGGHQTRSDSEQAKVTYNGPASTVSGVFLFFQIWIVQSLRSGYPRLQTPVVIYTIFANTLSTSTPLYADKRAAANQVKELVKCFFTGLAIATITSLFVYPTTSRTAACQIMAKYIRELRTTLKLNFTTIDILSQAEIQCDPPIQHHVAKCQAPNNVDRIAEAPTAANLRSATRRIKYDHARLISELNFARQEVALGKLLADDLEAVSRLLHEIMIPVAGLSFASKLLPSSKDVNAKAINVREDDCLPFADHSYDISERQIFLRTLGSSSIPIVRLIDEGLQHSSRMLELRASSRDTGTMQENITSIATRRGRHAESASGQLSSGQGGFCSYFERELNRLLENNRASFYVWIETMGYHLPPITSDYERSFDVVTMALIDEFERVGDVRWRHVSSFLYVCNVQMRSRDSLMI
jgi:hypothetical protein